MTIGTIGALGLARREALVPALKALLTALQESGYYLTSELVDIALRLDGESP